MPLKSNTLKYSFTCNPKFKSPNQLIIQSFCDKVFNFNKINNAEVSFVFCSDNLLSSLKKEYFNKNQYTDVIAFQMNEDSDKNLDGEIYISLDRALENSKTFKEPYEKEIIRLVIHGCLHLIGFNDQSFKEKKNMTKMEDKFLTLENWKKLFKYSDE
jgi:probable rRNA maturation factor